LANNIHRPPFFEQWQQHESEYDTVNCFKNALLEGPENGLGLRISKSPIKYLPYNCATQRMLQSSSPCRANKYLKKDTG
jgi:hypothetical protein